MKRLLTLTICILIVLLCGCFAVVMSEHPSLATTISLSLDEVAGEVFVLINAERQAVGLKPLLVNEHLVLMAEQRSQDMIDGNYYDHQPPPGHPTLRDLCVQYGYPSYLPPTENLVYVPWDGQLEGVANVAVESWRASPDHWRWVVADGVVMTGVGVAVADDHVIVTQLFWDSSPMTPTEAHLHTRVDW